MIVLTERLIVNTGAFLKSPISKLWVKMLLFDWVWSHRNRRTFALAVFRSRASQNVGCSDYYPLRIILLVKRLKALFTSQNSMWPWSEEEGRYLGKTGRGSGTPWRNSCYQRKKKLRHLWRNDRAWICRCKYSRIHVWSHLRRAKVKWRSCKGASCNWIEPLRSRNHIIRSHRRYTGDVLFWVVEFESPVIAQWS